MILFFDCEQFILRTIENCAPFVDKIYVLFSELPYSKYNPEARSRFKNTSSKEVLKESKYYSKVELIEGVWDTEEDQRNECLIKAKNDGFDFLIVQDADEFYLPEGYKKNIEDMAAHPDYSFYQVPWILFWKNTAYVLEYRKHGNKRNITITDCAVYAVNLNKNVRFSKTRILNDMNNALMLEGLCYHLSWVLSDDATLRKISTWSHSNQVNIQRWYKWKWLAWQPKTKHIGVINYIDVKKAVKFNGKLPAEIQNLPSVKQEFIELSLLDKLLRSLNDVKFYLLLIIKWPYYLIRYKINIL